MSTALPATRACVRVARRGARSYVERLPAGTLKKDLTPELAADIFWTVASPETYEALVARRGWTPQAFETWIAEAIAVCSSPDRAAW